MTRSSFRPWRPRPRASVASFPAAHRRTSGTNSAAPMASVIKPGNVRRIPPSMVATPGVSKCTARRPCWAKAARKRARSARPDFRSSRTHTADVAIKRAAVRNQPIRLATMTNASSSAAGSAISPINVHLTNDIDPIPASALCISLVGATVGIVYGPVDATICAGCSARASGSVRSRAYILAWEPISASADFPLPAPTYPSIPPRRPRACDVFDIYTIIFLALAVFIFLRLRSVLGQRTGRERPPYDPYSSARDAIRPAPGDKVVALPGRAPDAGQPPSPPADPGERWKGVAETGSTLASGLD